MWVTGMTAPIKSIFDCLCVDSTAHMCLCTAVGAGDFSFYEKAQQRMQDFIDNAGTLFLASHSESLLRQFCRRGLVFEQGSIAFDGDLESALHFYRSRA